MPRPTISLAKPAPGAQGNANDRLKAIRPLSVSSLFKHLSPKFFLRVALPRERTNNNWKENQHQFQTQTRKQSSSESLAPDDMTIPVPIPETGIRPTVAHLVPGFPPDVGFPESTLTISMTAAGSSFALSSSSVKHSSLPMHTTSIFAEFPKPSLPAPTPGFLSAIHSSKPQRTLSNTAIALLGIGAACLVVFGFILIKVCNRPRRRLWFTPSLPILSGSYLDNLESKESPLFGGKEPDDEWANSYYTTHISALPQPVKVAKGGSGDRDLANERSPRLQEKASFPEIMNTCPQYHSATCGLSDISSVRALSSTVCQPPYQQVQDAIIQTMKRLSSVSLSLSPGSTQPNEVGIALSGHETPLTGDGYFPMPRSRSKARQSRVPAYDGLDEVAMCYGDNAAVPQSSVQGGRTRIKSSYYAPGVHSRISNPIIYNLPKKPRMNQRRSRDSDLMQNLDNRAQPMGPTMPQVQWPQTTTTPVLDLQRVADSEEAKENHPNKLIANPGATLGETGICYKDENGAYGNTLTVPSLRLGERGTIRSQTRRTPDMPPRVPSPPLLPSLAQMAMEHHNLEDFENYRSPTYSINGLYGGETKGHEALCQ